MHPVHFKEIHDIDEILQVVELQKRVWGSDMVTSMPQLVASIHHGGVVIAAFHEKNIIGFCYGFPGFDGKQPYLVSHMAACHPDFRNQGLGKRLKEVQREWALARGYEKMVWTFDPLETRNAWFNLCKLGAWSGTYIPSFYGVMPDGLPADRLLAEWELRSERVVNALSGKTAIPDAWNQYPKQLDGAPTDHGPSPVSLDTLSKGEGILIAVPAVISALKQNRPELARAWRFALRHHLGQAFSNGYRVTGLVRTGGSVHYYVLKKEMH
jgi:predicted GNAT superfamily acetyltransferase